MPWCLPLIVLPVLVLSAPPRPSVPATGAVQSGEMLRAIEDLKRYEALVVAFREGRDDAVTDLLQWKQDRLNGAISLIGTLFDSIQALAGGFPQVRDCPAHRRGHQAPRGEGGRRRVLSLLDRVRFPAARRTGASPVREPVGLCGVPIDAKPWTNCRRRTIPGDRPGCRAGRSHRLVRGWAAAGNVRHRMGERGPGHRDAPGRAGRPPRPARRRAVEPSGTPRQGGTVVPGVPPK